MNDVVIVGAGPAGIAAAVTASEAGKSVLLLDDNPTPGGQIWRAADSHGRDWFRRLATCGCKIVTNVQVVSGDPAKRTLLIDHASQPLQVGYTHLILAAGARELFLPFPGWTLPNVMGVGGLQAMVKSGLPVAGKRVVVAGTGPLLLAVAHYLRRHGALVSLIAEQTPLPQLVSFGAALWRHPAKLRQAFELNPFFSGIRLRTNCWVEEARGISRLTSVTLRQNARVWRENCDYLACAFGFVPNTELASLLGCAMENGAVRVDHNQQTSVPGIYCAGEMTGIGGVDVSLLEGQIAGSPGQAKRLQAALAKARTFAALLENTFAPRAELRSLASPETIVCRCEDVTLAQLRKADSWRSAKLHERCGMGPCQGRICGPAVKFLLGWEASSVRPPLFPTEIRNLVQEHSVE